MQQFAAMKLQTIDIFIESGQREECPSPMTLTPLLLQSSQDFNGYLLSPVVLASVNMNVLVDVDAAIDNDVIHSRGQIDWTSIRRSHTPSDSLSEICHHLLPVVCNQFN
jgi:hypothetical protein